VLLLSPILDSDASLKLCLAALQSVTKREVMGCTVEAPIDPGDNVHAAKIKTRSPGERDCKCGWEGGGSSVTLDVFVACGGGRMCCIQLGKLVMASPPVLC
jgi:hypothetical protein